MKKFLTSFAIVCVANGAYAQFYIPEGEPLPNVTSVTNEGVAVGYNDQNCPFYIWDAVNNTQKLIGGISAGQGIGGIPRFSEDGKLIAAPMQSDRINVLTEWTNNTVADMTPYRFHRFFYYGDYDLFAVGSTPDGKEGAIMKTVNNGISWTRADMLARQNEDGKWENYTPDFPIYCMALLSEQTGNLLVGGGNGKLLVGGRNGASWKDAALTGFTLESPIQAYRDMAFTYTTNERGQKSVDKGYILVELEDGTYALLYTEDGTDSFSVAEGHSAKPETLGMNGKDFFVGTSDGLIQVSKDGGKTWQTVLTDNSGRPIHRIVFRDENYGIALSDNVVFVTEDGGETWTLTEVFPSNGIGYVGNSSTWSDAVWTDDYLTIVGTEACVYRSTDNGKTFSKVNGFAGDLGTVYSDARRITTVIGEAGNVWRKEDREFISGYTGGIYDVEADTWTPLTSTGYVSDSASSPWNISGDGKHVVGIAHDYCDESETVVSYAAIWDGTDNVTVLGNHFDAEKRACRANGVSYDGSVVAGWQDIWGPWFGCIWQKQDDGTYAQKILTVDSDTDIDELTYATDEEKLATAAKLVGAAQTVSADGKWVAGRGLPGMGTSGAWLWNEEEGFNVIYPNEDSTVADINADATTAVGWAGPGGGAWIWKKEDGRMDLQEYVESKLGHSLRNFAIASVYDMSPNGRYICGYGMYGDVPTGYVFDLFHTVGIDEMEAAQVKAAVYPNPASDELHVDLPFDYTELNTTLTLVNMHGQTVRKLNAPSTSNSIDIRGLGAGIYLLDVNANGNHKTFKVIVK